MVKTLIVGSEGFVGQHLVDHIKAEGIDKKTGENFLYWEPKKYKTIVFLAADLAFTKEAYNYNQLLYWALDKYMSRYPKTHIIFTSSCFVYGSRYQAQEMSLPTPENIYGFSKLLGEVHVKRYKNHTILRCSNIYGTNGHSAIEKFMGGGNIIHGTGEQSRDFVPVETVTEAIKRCIDNKVCGTYNIGSGTSYTINEIYEAFGEKPPKFDKKADYGLDGISLDVSKAKKAGLL